jgi:glycosyltransferase involved in cell wall biosynthesis
MNILGVFLVQELRTGGHVRYLELMETLAEDHDVLVLFNPRCGYRPRRFRTLDFPLFYDRRGIVPRSLLFALAALRAISRGHLGNHHEPDLVLVFGESNLAAARVLTRRYGCPLVFAYRSDSVMETRFRLLELRCRLLASLPERAKLWIFGGYEKEIARSASLIVFQSAADQASYLSRNSAALGRTAVVRGDLRQPRFKPEYAGVNHAESADRLLFIGNLGPRKGLRYLLDALGILAVRGLAPKLEVVGPGDDWRPFAELARRLGIDDRVSYRGRVENPFPYLRGAGLLVVPSAFDSYPNVILEALHAGCPAIGARTGGIPEMLGDESLLFAPQDAMSLADRLGALLADRDAYLRARKLCAARRERFDFDWKEAWVAALKPVLSGAGKGGSAWAE